MRFFRSLLIAVCCAMVCAVATAQVVYNGSTVYNPGRSAIQASNPSSAATANAYLEARVQGTTAGDPHIRLTIPGGTSWYAAADNSDSDKFEIGTGTAVGTSSLLAITSGGSVGVGTTAPIAMFESHSGTDTNDGSPTTYDTRYTLFGPNGGVNGGAVYVSYRASSDVGYIGALAPGVSWRTLTLQTGGGTLNLGGTGTTTNLSGRVTVTTDGRLFGTALHNNAGAVTGTASQYVVSGTYTPTLTNTTNVAASTARKCQWIRVGNVVSVSGSVDIDPTAAAATALGVSLPIASNLVNATDLGGTAAADGAIAVEAAAIKADGANDRASIEYTTVNIANHTVWFHFQYEVL